jgi:cell division protein FtsN
MNYHLSFNKKTAVFILVLTPLAGTLIFLAGYRLGLDRGFHRAQAQLAQQPAQAQPGPMTAQSPVGPASEQAAPTPTDSSGSPGTESTGGGSPSPGTEGAIGGSQSASSESPQPGGPITAKEDFTVQIGAFQNEGPAEQLKEKFSERGYSAFVFQGRDSAGQSWYVVRIGHFKELAPATRAAVNFTLQEKMPAYVRPLNEL